jgi:hypothetical protein
MVYDKKTQIEIIARFVSLPRVQVQKWLSVGIGRLRLPSGLAFVDAKLACFIPWMHFYTRH